MLHHHQARVRRADGKEDDQLRHETSGQGRPARKRKGSGVPTPPSTRSEFVHEGVCDCCFGGDDHYREQREKADRWLAAGLISEDEVRDDGTNVLVKNDAIERVAAMGRLQY